MYRRVSFRVMVGTIAYTIMARALPGLQKNDHPPNRKEFLGQIAIVV